MEFHLICEGRCNPTIGTVDTLIERFAQSKASTLPFDSTDRMIAAQRRLVYTAHFEANHPADMRCSVCGHIRAYGQRRPSRQS